MVEVGSQPAASAGSDLSLPSVQHLAWVSKPRFSSRSVLLEARKHGNFKSEDDFKNYLDDLNDSVKGSRAFSHGFLPKLPERNEFEVQPLETSRGNSDDPKRSRGSGPSTLSAAPDESGTPSIGKHKLLKEISQKFRGMKDPLDDVDSPLYSSFSVDGVWRPEKAKSLKSYYNSTKAAKQKAISAYQILTGLPTSSTASRSSLLSVTSSDGHSAPPSQTPTAQHSPRDPIHRIAPLSRSGFTSTASLFGNQSTSASSPSSSSHHQTAGGVEGLGTVSSPRSLHYPTLSPFGNASTPTVTLPPTLDLLHPGLIGAGGGGGADPSSSSGRRSNNQPGAGGPHQSTSSASATAGVSSTGVFQTPRSRVNNTFENVYASLNLLRRVSWKNHASSEGLQSKFHSAKLKLLALSRFEAARNNAAQLRQDEETRRQRIRTGGFHRIDAARMLPPSVDIDSEVNAVPVSMSEMLQPIRKTGKTIRFMSKPTTL